ncbi:hypothetical protein N7474_009388 [Penicillium riverlandense]|uniref:uncharacterized protein n=1 Tax=Penicillium riverlandense TaxID=1903569 RepID=UPI002547DE25|nr:uncharacterized protein N7474_009388 [Penicillium riverlandense]KAJ5808119.1 hypothetical protein N7474_009388 [Penicillium riverlandense]
MIVPFVGIFFALALWGSWFRVPGISDPNEPFMKRIAGAFEFVAGNKIAYEMLEHISRYTKSGHDGVYVRHDVLVVGRDYVDFSNRTTVNLDLRLAIWDEAFKASSPILPVQTICNVLFSLLVFGLVFADIVSSHDIYALRARVMKTWVSMKFLEDQPKVRLVEGRTLSLYEETDLLAGPMKDADGIFFGSFVDACTGLVVIVAPWEFRTVHLAQEVAKAIRRLELRRLLGVSPGSEVIVKAAEDLFTLSLASAATAPDAAAPKPCPSSGTLVRRCPESLPSFRVVQLASALVASWERRHPEMAEVTDERADRATNPQGSKRKPRPSQAKRRRHARRALREKQEELIRGFEEEGSASPAWGVQSASPSNLAAKMPQGKVSQWGPGFGKQMRPGSLYPAPMPPSIYPSAYGNIPSPYVNQYPPFAGS